MNKFVIKVYTLRTPMTKHKFLYIVFFLSIIATSSIFAQNANVELGKTYTGLYQRQGGYYDYSDPEAVNMKVSVWGFIKYPGRYLVPDYTTIIDLLSYAGGPTDDSHLDDLRLYRVLPDSTEQMFKFNFEDLLWENQIEVENRTTPKLIARDILIVPGSPKLYFKDWFRVGIQIFTAMISLTLLILRITNS